MPNEHDRSDRMGGDRGIDESHPSDAPVDARHHNAPASMAASSTEGPPRKKQRRGFAAMDPAKQKEIASKGGKASHEQGTGHEWTSDAAREAGRKGGQASHGGRGKRWGQQPTEGGTRVETPTMSTGENAMPGVPGSHPTGGSSQGGGFTR